ncbi:MAG: hypothetical protein LBD72_01400 [Puniceicoccales bacterium]|jgi:hypothetical protein|nr:hypothetical protein [Puniceicoccales bacterium]
MVVHTSSDWKAHAQTATFGAKKLADTVASENITGCKLLGIYRAQASNVVEEFKFAVRAAQSAQTTLTDSDVQMLANLQKHTYDLISRTGDVVFAKQNIFVRLFYWCFCDIPHVQMLKNMLKTTNEWLASRAYDARLNLDASEERTNVANYAKFHQISQSDETDINAATNALKVEIIVPRVQTLAAGNEVPIIAPSSDDESQWDAFFSNWGKPTSDDKSHSTDGVKLLPITEKTAMRIISRINSKYFGGNLLCANNPQTTWKILVGKDISAFNTLSPAERGKLVDLFNLILSMRTALPTESTERKWADVLFAHIITSGFEASDIDKSLFVGAYAHAATKSNFATVALPNVKELFSIDAAIAKQHAMVKYKGMEFMQHARSEPITIFTGAIVEKFATYASNPDAMQHMQAVIEQLPPQSRLTAVEELAKFANEMAVSLKTTYSPSKLNQLRAISELLLANQQSLPNKELLTDLFSVSNDIFSQWTRSCNEIASVIQIAALKRLTGVELSSEENKHIALLSINPRYGFCPRVYNTAEVKIANKTFDPKDNPNFRAYYGSENSLVSMDVFFVIPAVRDPSAFVTEDAAQSEIGFAVKINRDNGIILSEDGKLLTATHRQPPLIRKLKRVGLDIAKTIDSRSSFPDSTRQVIDGLVTIDLETGEAVHKTAGTFVELYTEPGPFGYILDPAVIAFKDNDDVVRVYSASNLSEPIFLIRDGKFYSHRNPERQLHIVPKNNDVSGLGLPRDFSMLLVGWDAEKNITEIVVPLERKNSPSPIAFVRNESSGRLEFFEDGRPTDRYLVHPDVLKTYFPFDLPDVFITASDSNPREVVLFDTDLPDARAAITLPEKKNGTVILGHIDDSGKIKGDSTATRILEYCIINFSKDTSFSTCIMEQGPNAKNYLRSIIAYIKTDRISIGDSTHEFDVRMLPGGKISRNMFNNLLLAWDNTKKNFSDPEYITLLGEAILGAAMNGVNRTYSEESVDISDKLKDVYKTIKIYNPSSQVLQSFSELANELNMRVAKDRSLEARAHFLCHASEKKFYQSEVARFERQKTAERLQDIRVHLPKPSKHIGTSKLRRVDLQRIGTSEDLTQMAGAKVRQEWFGTQADKFDLATVGAGALAILRGDQQDQHIMADAVSEGADDGVMPDSSEGTDLEGATPERQRLNQHRQKKSAETQIYADALWGSIAKYFDGTFDLSHPENFHITPENKAELQRKLDEAQASLGKFESGEIPANGDALKVYKAYQEATKVLDDILLNVSPSVKQMRLYGNLQMPTVEQLQMLLFRAYDYQNATINRTVFLATYQEQFDPFATLEQVEDIIGAIADQMVCKTALDASKTRVREFANFKKTIEQLINSPAEMGAESRKAKLDGLTGQKAVLQQAQGICQKFCAIAKMRHQIELERSALKIQNNTNSDKFTERINENKTLLAEINAQIDAFGKMHKSYINRDSHEPQIDSEKIHVMLGKIAAKKAEIEKQITNALPRLKKERSALIDTDAIIKNAIVKNTTYADIKKQLIELENQKRSLESAISLAKKKTELMASREQIKKERTEFEGEYTAALADIEERIEECHTDARKLSGEFETLKVGQASLLGEMTLSDDSLKMQTENGEIRFVVPAMEQLLVNIEQEIEFQVSDTKGRMLAMKEAYGTFVKAMASARTYDANSITNFFVMWFEFKAGFRLREDQVKMVSALIEKIKNAAGNTVETQALFQLMMGGGKTAVIISLLFQMMIGLGIVPIAANDKSQHETMTKDLSGYHSERYNGRIIVPNYEISAFRGKDGLKICNQIYLQFKEAKQVGAGISIQSTLLRGIVLERRNAIVQLDECRKKLANETDSAKKMKFCGNLAELEIRLKEFEKLLDFIHENGAMICDEVDLNLDPTFSVNIPNGKKETFNPVQADCIRKFFKIIDASHTIKSALRNGSGIDEETLGHVIDTMLGELKVPDDKRELYKHFICYDDTSGITPSAGDGDFRTLWEAERVRLASTGSEDAKLLEQLAMLRGLIQTERYASKKAFLESFGFRVDKRKASGGEEMETEVKVVPYSAANTPSSGEYAHPLELAVYTHHALLLGGRPTFGDESPLALKLESLIRRAINNPDSSAGQYLAGIVKNFSKDAQECKTAQTSAPRKRLTETAFAQLAMIYSRTGGNEERNQLISMLTASDFTFFPAMLEGTGYGQTHLTRLLVADSGTPWNLDLLSVGLKQGAMLDKTTDMQILDKWEKDMAAGNSTVFQSETENPTVATILDAQAKSHGGKSKPTCALIDVAGSFKHLDNRRVAEQARDYCASHNAPFKGFAYFDAKKKSWFVLPKDPKADPIELPNCMEKTVFMKAGVTREELFVYYDQNKTTGVDFKLPQSGRGLITMSPEKTLLSRFLQGILRMRGFWDGQSADICQVGGEPCVEQPQATDNASRLCKLFEASKHNQDQLLVERKVGAFIGQLTERKREILERAQQDYYRQHEWAIKHGNSPFVPSHWKRKYEELQAAASEVFKADARFNPINWYASLKSAANAAEHVQSVRETMARSLKAYGLTDDFLALTKDVADASRDQLADIQTAVGGSCVELGTQVEQQAEAEAESEQQMEVSTSNIHGGNENGIGDPMPDERYIAGAKTEAKTSAFLQKLLTGISGELEGFEKLQAITVGIRAVSLAALDDLDNCKRKFKVNLIGSTTTPKVPISFFKAVTKRAKAAGVRIEPLAERMGKLQKEVDKIFKKPTYKEGDNPDDDKIKEYFTLDARANLRGLFGTDFDVWEKSIIQAGISVAQVTQFTDLMQKCVTDIDTLVEVAESEKTINEDGLISLRDFSSNPAWVLKQVQNKLSFGAILDLVKSGILPLLGIFAKNGEISITDTIGGFSGAIGSLTRMAVGKFTGAGDTAMKELGVVLNRLIGLEYIDVLDAAQKGKVLSWVSEMLPTMLDKFFVRDEVDAAAFMLKVVLRLVLPPVSSSSLAQKKLADAILERSKDPDTGQYDMDQAIHFCEETIAGYAEFIEGLTNPNGYMCKAVAEATNQDVATGLMTLLDKLSNPLFKPTLAALQGVRAAVLEQGGQTVDQLPIRVAGAKVDDKEEIPSRKITDGAQTINAWIRDMLEDPSDTDTMADIFPENVLASEQFMRPFQYGNDPTSELACNVQRMIAYADSSGTIRGMFITDAEVESYGRMITSGTLKNAYFVDTRGRIDPQFLPPSCKDGALPTGDATFAEILKQRSRFAFWMQVFNGSVQPETLDEDQEMRELFLQDIASIPEKKSAFTAFLGAKTSDVAWIDRVELAA